MIDKKPIENLKKQYCILLQEAIRLITERVFLHPDQSIVIHVNDECFISDRTEFAAITGVKWEEPEGLVFFITTEGHPDAEFPLRYLPINLTEKSDFYLCLQKMNGTRQDRIVLSLVDLYHLLDTLTTPEALINP